MIRPLRALIIASLVLLPLAAFAGLMLLLFGQQQRKAVHQLLTQTAVSTAAAIRADVEDDIAVLRALAATRAFDRGDFAAFDDEARRLVATRPHWIGIMLSDRSRRLVNTLTPSESQATETKDREAVNRLVEADKPDVTGVMVDPRL